jgi:hypothetical protein
MNNNSNGGGGVYVSGGTFTMNGGEIRSNVAGNGGGVYVDGGTFTMKGGTISKNQATNGGGVYVGVNGKFSKDGGIIYGEDNPANGNKAESIGKGHAVYVREVPADTVPGAAPIREEKQKNSTSDSNNKLDSEDDELWDS